MKRKNFLSLFLGIGALVFALGMNYSYAVKDYGIRTNTLSMCVLGDVSDTTGEGGTTAKPKKNECKQVKNPDIGPHTLCDPGCIHPYDFWNGTKYSCEEGTNQTECKKGFVVKERTCTNLDKEHKEEHLSTIKCKAQ